MPVNRFLTLPSPEAPTQELDRLVPREFIGVFHRRLGVVRDGGHRLASGVSSGPA
jgi:hypothetical protein